MKIRTVILIVGSLLMAGFAALNQAEIMRTTTIHLGLTEIQAPLGLVLLGALVVGLCFFLIAMLLFQTGHLIEMRQVTKDAKEQRALADRAEQSRFTELRQWLETQQQTQLQREEADHQALWARIDALEQTVLTRLDESHNGLAAGIGEMEDRIERQVHVVQGQLPHARLTDQG